MENLEIDLSLALQMQAQFEEELRVSLLKEEEERRKVLVVSQNSVGNKKNHLGELSEPPQEKLSVSLVDPSWELIDPNPDIHTLFLTFNNQFFWGRLSGIEVKWSPRMTLCAGVCCYEGRGGLCSVRLSLPLLKLRPRKDLVETLLHEMIHAYLFVTANNRDRDGHGPEFHKHMYRINGVAGTKISVYHSFHDEVDVYRQHIWQCNGPCRQRRPYFGLVKRAMNRAPGPRDPWWQQHQQSCGGTYTKVQEPEGYGMKKKKNGLISDKDTAKSNDIRKFFGKGKSLADNPVGKRSKDADIPPLKENVPGFSEKSDDGNKGNARSSKASSNIHGFGSTSTGTVKHVNVNNASRSRVHGFSGNSPIKKKPRLGTGNTGRGGKTSSGAVNPGAGLAVKSGGGSRTVTVKGKTTHKTPSGTETEKSFTQTAFQGNGYALGGGNGVSRLLTLSNASSGSVGKKFTSTSNLNDHEVSKNFKRSSEDCAKFQNPIGKCPICSKDIPETVLDKHISDCVGEFDDDEDFDGWDTNGSNGNNAVNESVRETSTILVSSDDDDDDIFARHNKISNASKNKMPPQTNSSVNQETYPCPVCGDHFTQAQINGHLDTHF